MGASGHVFQYMYVGAMNLLDEGCGNLPRSKVEHLHLSQREECYMCFLASELVLWGH